MAGVRKGRGRELGRETPFPIPFKRLPRRLIKNGLLCADGSVANFVFSIIYLDYAHINFAQLENVVVLEKQTSQCREITLQEK